MRHDGFDLDFFHPCINKKNRLAIDALLLTPLFLVILKMILACRWN